MNVISAKHFAAYIQCPYKAYLLLCTEQRGEVNDFEKLVSRQKHSVQTNYVENLLAEEYIEGCLKRGYQSVQNVKISAGETELECALLLKREGKSSLGRFYYEPVLFLGLNQVAKEDKLELAFLGLVLETVQNRFSEKGTIINYSGKECRVELTRLKKKAKQVLGEMVTIGHNPPKLILNKHCGYCQFQSLCKTQACKEDNLSLLDRITTKHINKYEKKGILTVKQLSFTYKPRRSNKRTRKPSISYKPEIQALAIRTEKVYIQQLPSLSRTDTELYLDIEGIPDQNFYYLFGLLITQQGEVQYESYWVDSPADEERIWRSVIKRLAAFPESPIYHYGSFELSVFEKVAKRHQTDINQFKKRFVNVNTFIYGKVYFPAYSNSLKELGSVLGLKWTGEKASGLQTIVWRHDWEAGTAARKAQLLRYNEEDCRALKVLTDELTRIDASAAVSNDIDFVGKPKKIASETGKQVHDHFKSILQCSYANYDKNKIKFNIDLNEAKGEKLKKSSGKKGYEGQRKKMPKPTRVVEVPRDEFCHKHEYDPLRPTSATSQRLIIDLVFSKNGVRKTVTQYIGYKGYCKLCNRYHSPRALMEIPHTTIYGYNLKTWVVYQRVVLRLPYEKIAEGLSDCFGEESCWSYIIQFVREFSEFHIETEEKIVKGLLESPFIHADETPISVQGSTHYVWVFTNGEYVAFKLSASREAATAHGFLKEYRGVLISDFFAGYDNINCTQQKCWVHFIRDLNNDLWEVPFDKEFEAFVTEVRNLLLPIIQTVHKRGLKKRFLHKFTKDVDKFYQAHIENKTYKSDYCLLYQKRFIRYRDSLFTFLEHDNITWHNNTAERGLRHVCKQKTISGYFHASFTPHYLRMVGIMQTCRFQGKSFLKFLLSKQKDVDAFGKRSRKSVHPA